MGNIPVLKPREVARMPNSLGFVEVRQRGSHKQYRHPDGRGTTVPFHSRDISPFLLRQIAKDIGMTVQDFVNQAWFITFQPRLDSVFPERACYRRLKTKSRGEIKRHETTVWLELLGCFA